MPFHYANVLIFSMIAIGFVLIALTAGKLLRPHLPTPDKNMIYECGERPIGKAWFNFNPRFYLVALVFVIFEVEIAFMFPVAAVYRRWVETQKGGIAFVEILLFVVILAVGLAHVWMRGDLTWVKDLRASAREKAARKNVVTPAEAPGSTTPAAL